MSTEDYWVKIFQKESRLGAGFLFPPCYAVTASHCLNKIDPDDDRVDISLASGEILRGRVHRRSPEADLALIDIPGSSNMISTPMPSRAKRRDAWRSPYRPTLRDRELAGEVTSASMRYECDGGGIIEALQLSCAQAVDTYSGYSGSPIERDGPDDSRAVFGVLLEQFLETRSDSRLSNEASGDLIAATVSEIYKRFECFGAGVLLNPLDSPLTENSTASSHARMVADACGAATDFNATAKCMNSRSKSAEPQLELLRGLVTDGVLVPVLVPTGRLGALQDILNGQIEGEA